MKEPQAAQPRAGAQPAAQRSAESGGPDILRGPPASHQTLAMHDSPRTVAQRRQIVSLFGPAPVQRILASEAGEQAKAKNKEAVAWLDLAERSTSTAEAHDLYQKTTEAQTAIHALAAQITDTGSRLTYDGQRTSIATKVYKIRIAWHTLVLRDLRAKAATVAGRGATLMARSEAEASEALAQENKALQAQDRPTTELAVERCAAASARTAAQHDYVKADIQTVEGLLVQAQAYPPVDPVSHGHVEALTQHHTDLLAFRVAIRHADDQSALALQRARRVLAARKTPPQGPQDAAAPGQPDPLAQQGLEAANAERAAADEGSRQGNEQATTAQVALTALRTRAGGQPTLIALQGLVADAGLLTRLLARYPGPQLYALFNRGEARVATLEALLNVVANDALAEKLILGLTQPRIERILALDAGRAPTAPQLNTLYGKVNDAALLEKLVTRCGHALLTDLLGGLLNSGAVDALVTKLPDNAQLTQLVAHIGVDLLSDYVNAGAAADKLLVQTNLMADNTQRRFIFTQCKPTLAKVEGLMTAAGNDYAKIARCLSPEGGHKIDALTGYLTDRAGDRSKVWDPGMTCAMPALVQRPHPYAAVDFQWVRANAVPREGQSIPQVNAGWAGNRAWGAAILPDDAVLPQWAGGAAITYLEYDIRYYSTDAARGQQRIVVGSDGRKYHTADHYAHYHLIV